MVESFHGNDTTEDLQNKAEAIKQRESSVTDAVELRVADQIDQITDIIENSDVSGPDKQKLLDELKGQINDLANAENDMTFVELSESFSTNLAEFITVVDPEGNVDVQNAESEAIEDSTPEEKEANKSEMREKIMEAADADQYGSRWEKLKAGMIDGALESAAMMKKMLTAPITFLKEMVVGIKQAVKEWRKTLKAIGASIRDALTKPYDFGKMAVEIVIGFIGGGVAGVLAKRAMGVAKVGKKTRAANDNLASANDNSRMTKAERTEMQTENQRTGTDDQPRFVRETMLDNANCKPEVRAERIKALTGKDITPEQADRFHKLYSDGEGATSMRDLVRKREKIMDELPGFTKKDVRECMDVALFGEPQKLRNLPPAKQLIRGKELPGFSNADDLFAYLKNNKIEVDSGNFYNKNKPRIDQDLIEKSMAGDMDARAAIERLDITDQRVIAQATQKVPDVPGKTQIDNFFFPGSKMEISKGSGPIQDALRKMAKSDNVAAHLQQMVKVDGDAIRVNFPDGSFVKYNAADIQELQKIARKNEISLGERLLTDAVEKTRQSSRSNARDLLAVSKKALNPRIDTNLWPFGKMQLSRNVQGTINSHWEHLLKSPNGLDNVADMIKRQPDGSVQVKFAKGDPIKFDADQIAKFQNIADKNGSSLGQVVLTESLDAARPQRFTNRQLLEPQKVEVPDTPKTPDLDAPTPKVKLDFEDLWPDGEVQISSKYDVNSRHYDVQDAYRNTAQRLSRMRKDPDAVRNMLKAQPDGSMQVDFPNGQSTIIEAKDVAKYAQNADVPLGQTLISEALAELKGNSSFFRAPTT